MKKSQTKAGKGEGLGIAASRRGADMFAAAERHSQRVRLLKTVIPVVAVLLGMLFLAVTVFRPESKVDLTAEGVSLSDGRIVMASPKLDGTTRDNKPYTMQAERAFQNVKTGEIELQNITAGMPFTDTQTAALTAKGGWYDNKQRQLKLTQDIVLKTTGGMIARLQSADIDMNAKHLSTGDPVDITTSQARLTAESMQVSDGGKVLVFDGHVRMTIQPSALSPAQTSN